MPFIKNEKLQSIFKKFCSGQIYFSCKKYILLYCKHQGMVLPYVLNFLQKIATITNRITSRITFATKKGLKMHEHVVIIYSANILNILIFHVGIQLMASEGWGWSFQFPHSHGCNFAFVLCEVKLSSDC